MENTLPLLNFFQPMVLLISLNLLTHINILVFLKEVIFTFLKQNVHYYLMLIFLNILES